MNAGNIVLISDNFGERIISKVMYIPKSEIPAEHIALITALLNLAPECKEKEKLSQFACSSFRFRTRSVYDHYVLECMLSQSQSKALSYIFTNPYKKALEILEEILLNGFVMDEHAFSLAKENVIRHYSSLETDDPQEYVFMEMNVPFSLPRLSLKAMESITLDQLKESYSKIRDCISGYYIHIGAKEKNDPLLSLKQLNGTCALNKCELSLAVPDSVSSDVIVYAYKLNTPVSSAETYDAALIAMDSVRCSFETALQSILGTAFTVTVNLKDDDLLLVSIILGKGKGSFLSSFSPCEKYPFASFAEKSLAQSKTLYVRRAMDQMRTYDELVFLSAHSIAPDASFLAGRDISLENLLSVLQGLSFIGKTSKEVK